MADVMFVAAPAADPAILSLRILQGLIITITTAIPTDGATIRRFIWGSTVDLVRDFTIGHGSHFEAASAASRRHDRVCAR